MAKCRKSKTFRAAAIDIAKGRPKGLKGKPWVFSTSSSASRRSVTARRSADFIDANAAFVTQKGLYEYARARAGHYAKVLFAEKGFQDAAPSRRAGAPIRSASPWWRRLPTTCCITAARPSGMRGLQRLREIVLDVFDRYPPPAALDPQVWREARAELVHRLDQLTLHPPKRAIDIPEPYVQSYFDAMPIHEKLKKTRLSHDPQLSQGRALQCARRACRIGSICRRSSASRRWPRRNEERAQWRLTRIAW